MHPVIHTVDCLRSLSILWKAVANKQDLVEKQQYTSTEVEVVIMTKCEGTWVLGVAKAMLDVALSVTASIILFLLLLSGDIEENPGPVGGTCMHFKLHNYNYYNIIRSNHCAVHIHADLDYNIVDNSQVLSK